MSRQCYYTWLRRYEAEGIDGLKDRSSAPHHTPHATKSDVVEKTLWLRQQYHFGPAKIAMYVERYHDVKVSSSGIWRILKKVGLNRLPASQHYKRCSTRLKRYEKQRPGHQLQVDVKFIEPLGQTGRKRRCWPVHRHRRLHADPGPARLSAQRPEDRDPVHRSRPGQAALRHRVDPDRQRSGIRLSVPLARSRPGHRPRPVSSPRTPRLNGKVERSHRIDSEEFYRLLEGQVIDEVSLFNTKLQEWEDYYNYDRPHGELAGQTPYERLRQKAQNPLS
ncbi:helix-turn-helix domain-containing protein [Streptomyces sp. NBC_00555]|uniref:helix-turn-helix domain-containing protein n=1 Tax=Streptomyces sp. NBC_00555 TaxID=2903662 RepID=UPI0022547AB5|nr:helix-turn-helix domain-containing protein [Streptomyces sp. NBC_00555]MCX5014915.1 helix-turn-helix domain-containing protein [Streptomyces sp. NBC_00555]